MGETWILLVDMRHNNKHVLAISDDAENLGQFDSLGACRELWQGHPLQWAGNWIALNMETLETVEL